MIATTESRNKHNIRNIPPNATSAYCGSRFLPENPGMASAMVEEITTAEAEADGVFLVKDVAWILQVSRLTAQRLFDDGELAGWKIGTHRRIEPNSVRDYIIRQGNRPGRLKRFEDRLEQISHKRK